MKRVAAALIVAAAAAAEGQETARPPEGPYGRPRDEAVKMVDAYIVSNLQESLGLSDDQFAKLLPLVMRLHNDRREMARQRIQNLRELRRLLASGTATEARVEERLRELKRVENDEAATLRRDRETVDGALSPLQQAKFRVLEAEVEQKIRGLRSRMQMQDRPARGRRETPAESPRPQR